MIYKFPPQSEPIRQGDIFINIPKVEFDLERLLVSEPESSNLTSEEWLDVSKGRDAFSALVSFRPVTAIVITQNCDAVRNDDIALCEIRTFNDITGSTPNHPKGTMSKITKHSRIDQKWFYLPPDSKIGFSDKMAVGFKLVLGASRTYLEKNISHLRKGCLNKVAYEHFRERLSEYFRRYPYDEWYALDKKELEIYIKKMPEPISPYPWQK